MKDRKRQLLRGAAIDPRPLEGQESVVDLIDNAFHAYNAGRLREACRLFVERMLADDATVGMSLTGAMTPAGLGMSTVVPLMQAGFVDWVVSTGANLYHDAHFALGYSTHRGTPFANDVDLREHGVVRIYDIFVDYGVLLRTDEFIRRVSQNEEFQRSMSSAEYHYLLGGYLREREEKLGIGHKSLLSVAREYAVPVYTSSPGDSSIGMNVAELALEGFDLRYDVSADVNETAAIVLDAKRDGGASGVLMIGGGSPKNFVLQTEPQIQEVLGIDERGHDYYVQITDARVDTGGLSGATPGEAVSWGKVDPDQVANAVVCYLDCTVGLPLLAAYALAKHKPREPKRLYERREEMMGHLVAAYREASAFRDARLKGSALPGVGE
ncbi:MAG: deoxyhypusine synthase [Gemmatimonadales bacterium]|nr:deoxyhypusine synthase [Gemmatimonadales bacterium]NIN10397.1 deoxyhypusine synthase [Gemmatimonadales bacterium]NIN49189.1 deoxyhypusine synthase [Gemmatimonadales bacterium]NIP06653.1 deoxyhypusine synthase [Gemmatimonadales bacterium]NIQ99983.1 deoxyhypusine synthase [Gemmatimonadales bacterium]